MNRLSLFKLTIILILCFSKISVSEPFVVLEYRGNIDRDYNNSDNLFLRDLNYSSKHVVLKNETLSDIMLNYYGSKSFNQSILSLAIVHFNKRPSLGIILISFSGKQLYLPSINEIKNLIIKKIKIRIKNKPIPTYVSNIFFGG